LQFVEVEVKSFLGCEVFCIEESFYSQNREQPNISLPPIELFAVVDLPFWWGQEVELLCLTDFEN
jgi:hypothetical protein